MDIADCYRLLQLTSRANIEDLKASYRRLARQWHPDTNPGDQLAHEKFIQVTEAYKTLQKLSLLPRITVQFQHLFHPEQQQSPVLLPQSKFRPSRQNLRRPRPHNSLSIRLDLKPRYPGRV